MINNLYWHSYLKFEDQVKELTYYIALDLCNMNTYSLGIANLIIQIASEVENVLKVILNNPAQSDFPSLLNQFDVMQSIQIKTKELTIIYTNNNYLGSSDSTLKPFEESNRSPSPVWFKEAYNGLKHDRVNNISKGNLSNLLNALGGLYILNIYHAKNDIENTRFFKNFVIGYTAINRSLFSDFFDCNFLEYMDYGSACAVYDNQVKFEFK